jgi:hypothetical protein
LFFIVFYQFFISVFFFGLGHHFGPLFRPLFASFCKSIKKSTRWKKT